MNGWDDETRTRDLCRDSFTAPIATFGASSNPREFLLHPNRTQILLNQRISQTLPANFGIADDYEHVNLPGIANCIFHKHHQCCRHIRTHSDRYARRL